MAETFYEVLSVPPDADTEAITDAYREAVKETHPDVSDDPDAEAAFKRLTRARDVLTDPDKRAAYDALGHDRYVDRVLNGPLDPASVAPSDIPDDGGSTAASESTAAADTSGTEDTTPDWTNTRAGAAASSSGAGTADATTRREATDSDATAGWSAPSADGSTEDSADTGAVGWRQRARERRRRADDGYATRTRYSEDRVDSVRVPLTTQSLVIVGAMFVLYPVFVLVSVLPFFPLAVNALVGLCTLAMVGYLLSMPPVALAVFGAWGTIAPLAILAVGSLTVLSPVGVLALVATWVPLCLAGLTHLALRR